MKIGSDLKLSLLLSLMLYFSNPSPQRQMTASSWVQGQPGFHSECHLRQEEKKGEEKKRKKERRQKAQEAGAGGSL